MSERLSGITVIDGGMGKELRRIGAPFRQPEWSALSLLEAPHYVGEAHRNFIDAGAEVIITNTYAVVPFHLGQDRFDQRGRELVRLAADIARTAADEATKALGRKVLVAGSIPPLFGSYEPENFNAAAAPGMWRMMVETQAPFVDLWVGETISSTEEAAVLADVVGAHGEGKPLWLSFTLDDFLDGGAAVLRSGEPTSMIGEAIARTTAPVEAVLFNCTQPEVIGPALGELGSVEALATAGIRFGGYANAFPARQISEDDYAANEVIIERRDDLTADRYQELVSEWVEAGATIIGGCCDIYPEHIAALAEYAAALADLKME